MNKVERCPICGGLVGVTRRGQSLLEAMERHKELSHGSERAR